MKIRIKAPKNNVWQRMADFLDRFTNWDEGPAMRVWIRYAGIALVLILIQVLFLWAEDGLQARALLPVILFNGLFTPFLLALISLLDHQAVAAVQTMKPELAMTEKEFNRYEYRLAHMHPWRVWAAGLTVFILVVLMESLWITPNRYNPLGQLPVFTIVFQVIDKSSAFLFGVFLYHTVRQLLFVNTLLSKHVRINLFQCAPLQAFSKLTASTAIGLVVGVYGWVFINPDLVADPAIIGFAAITTLLAVSVFVLPLYGTHRRMKAARERALQALDLRFESIFGRFNHHFEAGAFDEMENLNGMISSLEIQYRKVKEVPTWPWRIESAQFVLTAVALPLFLAIMQVLFEQVFRK